MTQEVLKQMYQLLLTEPHAPTVCAQLERIAREALAEHAMRETQRLGQEIEQEPLEYWNAVEGWVKIDEVRKHFDSVGCGTIYKSAGEGRVPLCLAQPEQEPVAWGVFEGNLHDMFFTEAEAVQMADLKGTHAEVKPLYTAPPQRTEQEPDDIASILACRNMLDAQPVPPRENT